MTLEPCPSCHRHVRTSETVCPFCSAAIASAMASAPARVAPKGRLGRAALMSFGLTVGAAAAAAPLESCSDDDDAKDVGHNAVPLYGAPAPAKDAATKPALNDAATKPATDDAGGGVHSTTPPYGGAPHPVTGDAGPGLDAGATDASSSDAGDAATEDASHPDARAPTNEIPVYGAPPV